LLSTEFRRNSGSLGSEPARGLDHSAHLDCLVETAEETRGGMSERRAELKLAVMASLVLAAPCSHWSVASLHQSFG